MEILLDSLYDSLKLLPFLFLSYLFIEWYERISDDRLHAKLISLRKIGPVFGALLGCLPQCGFSVMAASLFGKRVISPGTLVAVFISTSDEALPILLSQPSAFQTLGAMLILKISIGMIAGIIIDRFWQRELHASQEALHHCDANESIWMEAIKRTLSIFLFLLLINIGLSFIIEFIGLNTVQSFLLSGSYLQPVVASVIGFIPNCAASILLTQLYLIESISFGSLIAGLITSAGVGLLMLFKSNANIKENMMILTLLFMISIFSGIVLQAVV